MAKPVELRNMPAHQKGDIPLNGLYRDKLIRVLKKRLANKDGYISGVGSHPDFPDEDIPKGYKKYDQTGRDASPSDSRSFGSTKKRPEFKDLPPKGQALIEYIHNNIGSGDTAPTFTPPDIYNETDKISEQVAQKYPTKEKYDDWFTTVEEHGSGKSNVYRLRKSPYVHDKEVQADGGYRWDTYNWERAVEVLKHGDPFDTTVDQTQEKYARDWFAAPNQEYIVDIFESVEVCADRIQDIMSVRRRLQKGWKKRSQRRRKRLIKGIHDDLEVISAELRSITDEFDDLVLEAFDCCSLWQSNNPDSIPEGFPDSHFPFALQEDALDRLEAKEFLLVRGNVGFLLNHEVSADAGRPEFLARLQGFQENMGEFFHWMWKIFEDLSENATDPEDVDESNDEESGTTTDDTTTSPTVEGPIGDELSRPVKETTRLLGQEVEHPIGFMKDEKDPWLKHLNEKEDALSWDEYLDELSQRLRQDYSEDSALKFLERAHNWGRNGDGSHEGICLWDMNHGNPGEDQEIRIRVVKDEDFFDENPTIAEWPARAENPDEELTLPPW